MTENASRAMLISAYRIHRFMREHTLADRPHASLLLAKISTVKLYNSMLGTNSNTLSRVVQADLKLQSKDDKCWTAQLLQAFQGLRNSENFEQAVRSGGAPFINDFSADLRYRLQGVWRESELVDPRGNNNIFAT
eukprot:1156852-Pelagomonas_calceolata.AAC.2